MAILRLALETEGTYLTGQPLLDWLNETDYEIPFLEVPVYSPPERPDLPPWTTREEYYAQRDIRRQYSAERAIYMAQWDIIVEMFYEAQRQAGYQIDTTFDLVRRVEYTEKNRRKFRWEYFLEDQTDKNFYYAGQRVTREYKNQYVQGVGVVQVPVDGYQEIAFGSTNGLQRV